MYIYILVIYIYTYNSTFQSQKSILSSCKTLGFFPYPRQIFDMYARVEDSGGSGSLVTERGVFVG